MRAAVSNDLGLISRILSLAPHTMNLQTIHGHTAVMFAATSGSTDALRLLLRVQGTHAADLTLREKDSGLTVVELVERQEEEESREVREKTPGYIYAFRSSLTPPCRR